MQFQFPNLSFT